MTEENAEAWFEHLRKDEAEARRDSDEWAKYQENLHDSVRSSRRRQRESEERMFYRSLGYNAKEGGDGWMSIPEWRE